MGTLKTTNIQSISGSGTVTLGVSGETFTNAAGTTFTVSNGTMSGQMYPAFAAYLTADQTITNATYTKVAMANEYFDTDSAYDASTNYRFTVPTGKAGKYFLYGRLFCDSGTNSEMNSVIMAFKLNGSTYIREQSTNMASNPGRNLGLTLTAIVDLSASDYIELWVNPNDASGNPIVDGATVFGASGAGNEFGGYRIGA
jgi:hypothetical protein